MKKILPFLLLLSFCTADSSESLLDIEDSPNSSMSEEPVQTSTSTSIEVTQLESFEEAVYKVNKEMSSVSYLAPKQFLNANLEIVEGVTREISGEFKITLGDCDSADSCLQVRDLIISADLTTLKSGSSIRDGAIQNNWLESKLFPEAIYTVDEIVFPNNNFDSKIDETIVGILTVRNIEVNVPFSITAYMENEIIYVSGITEIDTTWFGFDAPTKFNAWEVLNPIGIKISIVAEK
ncbi:YceI family protein [Acidimicrobiia bacterium]|nr:YceI family protein [Acidimicrobiia bacterium]